jgi:predicted nucleic acid-binding Zn ribbon protein
VERIISNPTGIIFKGSGFYVTDNRGARKTTATTSENGDAKADTSGDAKADSSGDSTPKADSGTSSKEKSKEKKVS